MFQLLFHSLKKGITLKMCLKQTKWTPSSRLDKGWRDPHLAALIMGLQCSMSDHRARRSTFSAVCPSPTHSKQRNSDRNLRDCLLQLACHLSALATYYNSLETVSTFVKSCTNCICELYNSLSVNYTILSSECLFIVQICSRGCSSHTKN